MRTLLFGLIAFGCASAQGKLELVAEGLNEPFAFGFLGKDVLLTEFGSNRIVRISPDGKISVVAGSGKVGGENGFGLKASMNAPHNVALLPDGLAFVSDTQGHRLRILNANTGLLGTVGGSDKGFAGDGGPVSLAKFDQLYHVAISPKNDVLFVCDLGNRRVRSIDLKSEVITTVAGNGKQGKPIDGGKATEQPLVDPRAVEMDSKGRLWILERGGHALRVVEQGKISTVAGTGEAGFAGDGGPALKAKLNGPKGLFITAEGKVLIADAENNCIREYDPETKTIRRVAGTWKSGKGQLGRDPLETDLKRPHAVGIDSKGTMYISDSYNGRLLKVVK